jgi:hypothetical protein
VNRSFPLAIPHGIAFFVVIDLDRNSSACARPDRVPVAKELPASQVRRRLVSMQVRFWIPLINFLPTAYSTQRRNQYTGPRFFDMDMGLFKTFRVTEGVQLGVGAQAFNVFNHPNVGQPDNGLGDPTFGQINSMQPMPTSPYGVFLGFDSSVRVVQVSGNFIFWPVRLCNRRSRTVRLKLNRAVPQGIALLLSLRKLLIYPA